MALVGGAAFTPPDVVRRFEGNKFPLLVRAGHRVTVELSRVTRRRAALAYGPHPQHAIHLRDGHRVMTFVACRRNQESGSSADGAPVTFWSGFIIARSAQCVHLRVWVDREPAPRKTAVALGRQCG